MKEFQESARSIPARYLTSLPEIFFFLFLFWLFGVEGDSKASHVLFWINLVALVVACIAPIFEYKTHRFTLTLHDFQLKKGWLEKETRKIPLDSIVSLNVEQPWNYRLFDVYKVTLKQSGKEELDSVLSGVRIEDVDALRQALREQGGETYREEFNGEHVENNDLLSISVISKEKKENLFSASYRDVILMGMSYGQVFILGIGAFFTVSGFLEDLHLQNKVATYIDAIPLWILVPVAIGLGVCVGIVLTIIRFYGFSVSSSESGELMIRYGLAPRKQRQISPHHLSGLALHQNIIEKFFGLARLSVLSRDSSIALESNLVLPPVSVDVIRKVLDTSFAGLYTHEFLESFNAKRIFSPLLVLAITVAVTISVGCGVYKLSFDRRFIAGGLLITFLLTLYLIRLLTMRFQWNNDAMKFVATAVTLSKKTTIISGNSLVYVTSHRRSPYSRSLVSRVKTYCGKTLRFAAFGVNCATVTNMQSYVQKGS